MKTTILFVGDASWDITLAVDHIPNPDEKIVASGISESAGGVVANAAVAAAMTGANVRGLFRLGSDCRGNAIADALGAANIALGIGLSEDATALAVIIADPQGEKRLIIHPSSSMYPSAEMIDAVDLDEVAWVHTAAYDVEAATRLIQRCRDNGTPWSIDLEPATYPKGIDSLATHLEGAAVVFCNDGAAAAIGVDPVDTLIALGVRTVVRTCGRRGAELHQTGTLVPVVCRPPAGVNVLDTTGAGDCLAGWHVAGLVAGFDQLAALDRAVVAASISCGRLGAQLSYPTTSELNAHLRELPQTAAVSATKEPI